MPVPGRTSDDARRWERVQALFHDALGRPGPEREAFLRAACAGDAELQAEVLALLAEDARGATVLDRDVAGLAAGLIGGGRSAPLPTHDFGPYRIRRVLGEGGMGVVYLAERQDLGSRAAIKILRDASLSPARRERFASEQRTLAQLNHPSIAHLYDADALPDGTPWFAMEYVEGVPLAEYCSAHACPIPERLRLFREVCEAVQHAHGHAVIHRDLKPSNILVKPDGSVKLLDFGIAKQLESLDLEEDRTRTAFRLMTPAYAAPEQFRGDRVGVHTDVYALGAVLYELLAGRLPFDLSNRTPGEAETLVVQQQPEKPSVAARGVIAPSGGGWFAAAASRAAWADLDVLCLTAMHKEPERRYRTVDALIRDVDHYLKGEPLEARPDSLGYRAGKFARRHWRPLSAAALALAMVAGTVAFYTVRLARARNAALAEAARTQRIQRFMLNLFEGNDEEAGPAESLRVVTLVDRGALQARSLDAEPAVQAELYQTLGGLYQDLGRLEEADSLLRAALDRRRSVVGLDHPDVAKGLVALGLLRVDQARLDDAERLVREGLEISRRKLPADHPIVAEAMVALGKVLEERGEYARAIPVLEQAVRLRSRTSGESPELSATLTELANTHFYAGNHAVSDSLNRRILALSRRLYGDRHPFVANDLINLGAVQFEWGRYAEAERYYRRALDITRTWYGDDHPRTASNLTMLGRALVFQDRYDEGAAVLQQSLAIQERVYGPVHPRVASTLNELGSVSLMRHRLDEAEAQMRRVLDIYRRVHGDGHQFVGVAQANLAGVYMERNQPARAETSYREALRCYARTLPPDHLNVGIGRIKLGRSLLRQHRFAEAARESRAGYEIVARQSDPGVSFLTAARKDLVTAYEALRQPELAARFRAELADTAARRD
jgi:serine/threonine-protein kinase